ncbi:MAG: ATP-binding protein [Bacteroidetes bacterium]|nr:ATP-binding protein [Bacteroidota bacterium]MBL7067116.1 ATP-binding protein [Candidatus Neomarinimicrobiota bacterium]
MMKFVPRNIEEKLLDAISYRPVVLLNGARQTGKSTLVKFLSGNSSSQYYTFDDFTLLSSVNNDPEGFISGLQGPVIIDEVQRIPKLFIAIKRQVDRNREPGQFLLTGSANILLLPNLSESLTGRMEIQTLWPFSNDEIHRTKSLFIDHLFSGEISFVINKELDREGLIEKILTGGYPEVQTLSSEKRKQRWFRSYVTTIIQREIQDLSKIEGLFEIPRLLSILASQSASILNISNVNRKTGISNTTMKRYLSLLQAVFLIQLVPAWYRNVGKRLIKSPKLYINDTGLLTYLLGLDRHQLMNYPDNLGPILENYVMNELVKQSTWCDTEPKLFYYRTARGKEVDFVLENNQGKIVGIEVKSSNSVDANDFRGLKDLSETAGDQFVNGVVLYLGENIIPFGKKYFALPISALWK